MRASLLLLLPLATAFAGCGKDATSPEVVDVSVTLREVDASAGEILLEAVATNTGTVATIYTGGCPGTGRLEVHAAGGEEILVENPCAVGPACPAYRGRLEPGESVTFRFPILGVRWPVSDPPSCEGIPLEPGTYTARVIFRYSPATGHAEGESREASTSRAVVWPPAA